MKIKIKHLLVAIIILFGFLAIISSTSACMSIKQAEIDLDEGNKIIKTTNGKCYVSWYAYRYSKNKDDKIMIHKNYKLKNKKGKVSSQAYTYYEIERLNKNRIKVTTTYSTEPQIESVKTYKTTLSVKTFYFKHIKTQFAKKVDKKAFYNGVAIDKGKLETILPFNDSNSMNISSVKHHINWTTESFTGFPDVLHISQSHMYNASGKLMLRINKVEMGYFVVGCGMEYYPPSITLQKINKNTIKIQIGDMHKLNGDMIIHRTYTVKTKLSVKNYYQKVFKQEMTKMFSSS